MFYVNQKYDCEQDAYQSCYEQLRAKYIYETIRIFSKRTMTSQKKTHKTKNNKTKMI